MDKKLLDVLKNTRKDHGLSQKDVANQLGIKGNTISNWENGVSQPDIDSFVQLCKIYNLDFSNLLENIYGPACKSATTLSYNEQQLVKKYRALDERGKDVVDAIVNQQYEAIKPEEQDGVG